MKFDKYIIFLFFNKIFGVGVIVARRGHGGDGEIGVFLNGGLGIFTKINLSMTPQKREEKPVAPKNKTNVKRKQSNSLMFITTNVNL